MRGRDSADHRYMVDRCAECLAVVPRHVIYRAPDGQRLCSDCYFALWGLREGEKPRKAQRLAAPRHRRRRRIFRIRRAAT